MSRACHLAIHFAFSASSAMIRSAIGAGQFVHGTDGEPGLAHLVLAGHRLGVGHAGLGVQQDQGPHPLGRGERDAQGEEPALAHPADDGPVDAEVVEQRRGSRWPSPSS